MIKNSMALKDKIRNESIKNGISQQVLMQNYIFEKLLKRITLSKYKDNFILKGGLLLSSIFGIDTRTTMDMDTLVKGISINKLELKKIIEEICNIDLKDEITFKILDIQEIKKEDQYGGFRFKLKAFFENLKIDLSLDISTGDVITPREIKYQYKLMFEDEKIPLLAYNNETILAEKIETIITKGVVNGRMKDYYDFYKFWIERKELLNFKNLRKAITNTFSYRKSNVNIDDIHLIINNISNSLFLKNMWANFQRQNSYAKNIEFNEICNSLNNMIEELDIILIKN